jgi:hypothetical protein
MTDKIKNMMTRIHLKESSVFKNIVALTDSDMKFLRELGLYIYEGYQRDIKSVLDTAKMESNLFDQLNKQSQTYLKNHDWVYWNEKSVKESYDIEGYHLCSLTKERFERKKGVLCRKRLNPNNVALYLPVVEDWIDYYKNTCDEGIDRRIVLDCVSMPLRNQRMNKFLIVKGSREEMVDSRDV